MPKEMIMADSMPYGDDSPARAAVELRWDRESEYVSLATRSVHTSDHSTFIPDWVKKDIEETGTLVHTQMLCEAGDERHVIWTCFDGFYVGLDRKGINRLIRNLRRARDQAFGRDE